MKASVLVMLAFHLTGSTALGVRGPACSLDGGRSWRWLGAKCVKDKGFTYTFAPAAKDVRFSFGMPYQENARTWGRDFAVALQHFLASQ